MKSPTNRTMHWSILFIGMHFGLFVDKNSGMPSYKTGHFTINYIQTTYTEFGYYIHLYLMLYRFFLEYTIPEVC